MTFRSQLLRVSLVLLILACFVAVVAHTAAHAQQSGTEVKITELERRVAALDAEKLSERIARLETLAQNNNTLLLAVLGAVAAMLIERAVRIGIGKRSQ